MLKLKTPWQIGTRTFTHAYCGLGKWDSRARRIEVTLCLATDNGEFYEIGALLTQNGGGSPQLKVPNLAVGFRAEDLQLKDERITRIFEAGRPFFRAIEELIVDRQFEEGGIAFAPQQFGMDDFSLECERESTSGRPVKVRHEIKADEGPPVIDLRTMRPGRRGRVPE